MRRKEQRDVLGDSLSASNPTVAVLVTMNTKSKEAQFVADVLARAGAVRGSWTFR